MRREDHLLKNLQGLCFGNKYFNKFHSVTGECWNVIANSLETLGPFIQGKLRRVLHKTRLKIIRRKLYHLYEHVFNLRQEQLVQMVRILFLFLTRFHVNVARSNGNPTWRAKN